MAVGLAGLVDDIRTLRPTVRIAIEIAASLAVFAAGIRVNLIGPTISASQRPYP